jgi:hypothetical protein
LRGNEQVEITEHDGRESAAPTLNRSVHLNAHTMLETHSVLTRLPPPPRVLPLAIHAYLAGVTSSDYLTLDARSHRGLVDHLAEHGVTGGATCDGLVGLTAKAAGATLLTHDVRLGS